MALPIRDDAPTRRIPWVTYGLLLANVVVFLFVQPSAFQDLVVDDFEAQEQNAYVYEWGAIPCEIAEGEALADDPGCTGEREENPSLPEDKVVYLSLLTCMFLHGNIIHLAGNMLFLWVFGNNVEDRLGPAAYLALYLVTGLVGTLGHVALNLGDAIPLIGASGAIAGLMGAYLAFTPRGRVLTIVPSTAFQVVYVPAWVVLGLFFVTQFFTPDVANVAWVAHAAGMAAGFLLALPLKWWYRAPAFSTQ